LRDLGGRAEAPEWYGGRETLARAHRIAELRNHSICHRPFDEGRMHRIAAHRRFLPRAMERYRFGEEPHAALRGVVRREVMSADQPRNRGDVDDRATAAPEQRHGVLAAQKRA